MSVLNYGLTFKDLEAVRDKLQRQRAYLEKHEFYSSFSGQVKTLLDVSMSPNHSARYYAMILNKVSTFISYNFDKDLTPLFLTITLDGFFRDFLRGDYSRWKKYKDKYKNHIPNNERFGYYLNQIDIEASKSNPNPLTPKDLYKILSFQFFRFIRSYTLQKLKKEGLEFTFIKVHEPHKDGVPHLHILFYLPSQYIKPLYYHFKNFFPAPRNHQKLNFRDNGRTSQGIYETQGFQWKINSPMGYILKYILKSFRNVQNNEDIDYLQAWYVHYKIPRIIFSRTLIPQDVYYKASLLEDDWFYLTLIRRYSGGYLRNKKYDYFRFDDEENDRHIYYFRGYFMLVSKGHIVRTFGISILPSPVCIPQKKTYSDKDILNSVKVTSLDSIEIVLERDGKEYLYFKGKFLDPPIAMKYKKLFKQMYSIFSEQKKIQMRKEGYFSGMSFSDKVWLYHNFDFDVFFPWVYCDLHNALVDDGYIKAKKISYEELSKEADSVF